MNFAQKAWIIVGLIALAVSLLFAPFNYVGHIGIVNATRTSGTLFRPIASPPERLEIIDATTFIDASELDAGKLALIWGAVGIVCLAGIGLSSGKSAEDAQSED